MMEKFHQFESKKKEITFKSQKVKYKSKLLNENVQSYFKFIYISSLYGEKNC